VPSGRAHTKGQVLFTPVALVVAGVVQAVGGSAAWAAAGYAAGFVVTPDSDLVTVTNTESWVLGFFPPVSWFVGGIWLAVSTSYAKMCGALLGGHRGVSHWPGVGTATRVAWWMLWCRLLSEDAYAAIYSAAIGNPGNAVSFYIGLMLADALHWAMDTLEDYI